MISVPLISNPARSNLRRLFLLRNIVIAGQGAAIAAAVLLLDISLPLAAMATVIAILALFNLRTWLRLRQERAISDATLLLELLVDIAGLTALLSMSGGSTNPFVSLYLLPIAIASIALPAARAWLTTLLCIGCYSLLLFYSIPLTHGEHQLHSSAFNLHVVGMWITFLAGSVLITGFVTTMSASIRARDRELAAARERALRDEQVVALGTFAAGAAHELGTPLSTIAVLSRELEIEHAGSPGLRDDLAVLREQVDNCKRILTGLTSATGHARAEQAGRQNVREFVDGVVEKWTLLRPPVRLTLNWSGSGPVPDIVGGETISQTLINVLNNAADASPTEVEIDASWNAQTLTIEVRDRGQGVPEAISSVAGRRPVSTKSPERGLGLFLANATVERLGGSVRLFNRAGGGGCTRITLPLALS